MITFETFGFVTFHLFLAFVLYQIVKNLWIHFLAYRIGFGVKWNPGYDNWAVITGGTDGIGLEYAKKLLKIGYSVLLISRNESKLNAVKNVLQQINSNNHIDSLAIDFTERYEIYDEIKRKIDEIEADGKGKIDVLVNNVGMSLDLPLDNFSTFDFELLSKQINCNLISCIKMTQIVLPKMIKHKRGVIINIASIAGALPIPFKPIYSATKVFMDQFSMSLNVEYKDKGIIIQSVLPGYVSTKLAKNIPVGPFVASPKQYVESAMQTVGIEDRTYGWWQHKLLVLFAKTIQLPFFMFSDFFSYLIWYRYEKNLRKTIKDK